MKKQRFYSAEQGAAGGGTGGGTSAGTATTAGGATTAATAVAPAAAAAGGTDARVQEYLDKRLAELEKKQGEKLAELTGKLTAAEQRQQEREQADATAAAAKGAGAKDAEYFGFLAGKERAAKGAQFDLGSFVTELKAKRPELFEQPKQATTGAGTPALPSSETDALKAQLTEAEKKGDVMTALRIRTRLQQAGVKA